MSIIRSGRKLGRNSTDRGSSLGCSVWICVCSYMLLLQVGCGRPEPQEIGISGRSSTQVVVESRSVTSLGVSSQSPDNTAGATNTRLVRHIGRDAKNGQESQRLPTKNVLFIIVDDLRPELGCYGRDDIHSPNIDRLAAGGLLFNRAYCQQAVCNASRSSFMLGMRPDSAGVVSNQQHFRDSVGEDVVTLGEHFRNHHYESLALGKVFHGPNQEDRAWGVCHYLPLDICQREWPETDRSDNDRRYYFPHTQPIPPRNWRPALVPGITSTEPTDGETRGFLTRFVLPYECCDAPESDYIDGWLTDDAIQHLRRVKNRPFFLAVGYRKPHVPFVAPKKYWDLYNTNEIQPSPVTDWPLHSPKRAHANWPRIRKFRGIPQQGNVSRDEAIRLIHGYRACVSFVDACIGRLVDELDRLGLADQTVIVLFGDNGFKLSEFSAWSKHTNYEVDTRVPLIIRAPGTKGMGAQSDALVELVDLFPTLCELTGLPLPEQLEGTSLVSLLDQPGRDWKRAAFSQFPRGVFMGYAMRTKRHRLVRWMRQDVPRKKASLLELYNLEHDSVERVNLAGDPQYADLVAQLIVQSRAGWQAAKPMNTVSEQQPLAKSTSPPE